MYYLNRIECIIDNLIWMFLQTGCVKQKKKIGFYAKIIKEKNLYILMLLVGLCLYYTMYATLFYNLKT